MIHTGGGGGGGGNKSDIFKHYTIIYYDKVMTTVFYSNSRIKRKAQCKIQQIYIVKLLNTVLVCKYLVIDKIVHNHCCKNQCRKILNRL